MMNDDAIKHIASAIGTIENILVAAILATHLVPTLMGDPIKSVPWSLIVSGIGIWIACQAASVIILIQLKKEEKPVH